MHGLGLGLNPAIEKLGRGTETQKDASATLKALVEKHSPPQEYLKV